LEEFRVERFEVFAGADVDLRGAELTFSGGDMAGGGRGDDGLVEKGYVEIALQKVGRVRRAWRGSMVISVSDQRAPWRLVGLRAGLRWRASSRLSHWT